MGIIVLNFLSSENIEFLKDSKSFLNQKKVLPAAKQATLHIHFFLFLPFLIKITN